MPEYYTQIFCDLNSRYYVIIEDDERVAYSYLLDDNVIIGEVWLYNKQPSPQQENWDLVDQMPFLNPKEYVKEELFPISDDRDIDLEWILSPDGQLGEVKIFIRKKLIAKMKPGSTPGWSTVVKKNGPLAHILQ